MYTQKTLPTDSSVEAYLAAIEDNQKQADCRKLVGIIESLTKTQPIMWGAGIIGFGAVHYTYKSGHEGDVAIIGLSARKQAITLYGLMSYETNIGRVATLGKCKLGKGCLYIKQLSDINLPVLEDMIDDAWKKQGTYLSETR